MFRQHYKYKPLNPATLEIRLLRVTRHDRGEVHLSMHHFPLSTELRYITLSYMWGKQPRDDFILIDDKIFEVRPNLHAFLSALKTYGSEAWFPPDSYIWIDALCINQDDLKERSSQVMLMGQIYASSRKTLVWLEQGDEVAPDDPYVRMPVSEIEISVQRISQNAYWRRLWPCQEVILAAGVLVIYGDETRSFDSFLDKVIGRDRSEVQRLALWRHFHSGKGSKAYLNAAIEQFGRQQCSDKKDRLFAILSLIKQGADFPVDYRDDIATIFWKALCHFNGCYDERSPDDSLQAGVALKTLFELESLSAPGMIPSGRFFHIEINRLENHLSRFFSTCEYVQMCLCSGCSALAPLMSTIEGAESLNSTYTMFTARSLPYKMLLFSRTQDGGVRFVAVGNITYGTKGKERITLWAPTGGQETCNAVEVIGARRLHALRPPSEEESEVPFDILRRQGSSTVQISAELLWRLLEFATAVWQDLTPGARERSATRMHAEAKWKEHYRPSVWQGSDAKIDDRKSGWQTM